MGQKSDSIDLPKKAEQDTRPRKTSCDERTARCIPCTPGSEWFSFLTISKIMKCSIIAIENSTVSYVYKVLGFRSYHLNIVYFYRAGVLRFFAMGAG